MRWIPFHPPRIGLKVRYRGDELATAGIYTVVENDEYDMIGYVVIEDDHGRLFGRSAELLEPVG